MIPLQIKVKNKSYLLVNWNDGSEKRIKLATLRRHCPCAVCSSMKEEQGDKYIPIYSGDQIEIKRVETIGNYALGISWGDSHNTGLYDFNYLMKISEL